MEHAGHPWLWNTRSIEHGVGHLAGERRVDLRVLGVALAIGLVHSRPTLL